LRFSDQTLGILVVDRTSQRVFSEVEILHLEIFAIQLVEMIQMGKLYLDQLDRNKEYRFFYRAMSALGQSLATQEVLESLANICEGVVPFTHLIIALLDSDGMAYQIAVSRGNEKLKGQKIKSHGRTWISWILNADPGPLLLKDIRSHTSNMPIAAPNEGDMPVCSVLFIQLKAKGRKLGALFIGAAAPDAFNNKHLRMLNLICQHASANIENSLLHQRVESERVSDVLTQLHNHRYFQERLTTEVSRARRSKSQLSLLMADIDHFKSVNDSYGHRIGDMILQRVAEILKKTIRTEDSIARYGGEEFVIILTESERKGALVMAERLRKAIERVTFNMEGNSIKITISIGSATYPADGSEPWELIEHADRALYAAKEQGRNRAVQYHNRIASARNTAS
jgi:diguanylate cyclase (GGDEF)-like protein